MSLSANDMRLLFDQTVIIRKPRYGIVSGYHELPYVCVGESFERQGHTTRIEGKVQVSPRFILRPSWHEPSYDEIFGNEHVDAALVGRMFGFLGFKERPVECKSEYLKLEHLTASVDQVLGDSLDALERQEDITTGVFVAPNTQYFPVSVERFIASVLEDEFNV